LSAARGGRKKRRGPSESKVERKREKALPLPTSTVSTKRGKKGKGGKREREKKREKKTLDVCRHLANRLRRPRGGGEKGGGGGAKSGKGERRGTRPLIISGKREKGGGSRGPEEKEGKGRIRRGVCAAPREPSRKKGKGQVKLKGEGRGTRAVHLPAGWAWEKKKEKKKKSKVEEKERKEKPSSTHREEEEKRRSHLLSSLTGSNRKKERRKRKKDRSLVVKKKEKKGRGGGRGFSYPHVLFVWVELGKEEGSGPNKKGKENWRRRAHYISLFSVLHELREGERKGGDGRRTRAQPKKKEKGIKKKKTVVSSFLHLAGQLEGRGEKRRDVQTGRGGTRLFFLL